jgi:copper homeostasis protein
MVKSFPLLEIAVETLEAAQAAQRGGADRLELCAELHLGGITPPLALLNSARTDLRIPIFVIVRPRAGDFMYSAVEFEEMKAGIAAAKNAGANGIVVGILTHRARVDIPRTGELVALASPLPVTFHRAFDEIANLPKGLEDVIKTGATRILTSGGAKTAFEGRHTIASLIAAAAGSITIVPGAGINPQNISQIAATTRASEFHSGLGRGLPYPRTDYLAFERSVRELVDELRSVTG